MENIDLGGQLVRKIAQPLGTGANLPAPAQTDAYALKERDEDRSYMTVQGKPWVAVMPLTNESGNPDDDYFTDGLSEDIIMMLSRYKSFSVVAKQSTFAFKGQAIATRQAAASLGARFLLEGSVRKAGNRVRVNANLIDTITGKQVWGERYDRELADVFKIQDEITEEIVKALAPKVETAMARQAMYKRPQDMTAYDYVLRARQLSSQSSPDANAEARQLIDKALELDPNYARAYAELSRVHLTDALMNWNAGDSKSLDLALNTAKKAVGLDANDAFGHHMLAMIYYFRKQRRKFEAEAELALELDSNDSQLLADIGIIYVCIGKYKQGVTLLEQAMELHPFHPDWYYFGFVIDHFDRRAYPAALIQLEKMDTPDFFWKYVFLVATHGHLGNTDDAAEAREHLLEIYPDFTDKADDEFEKWDFSRALRNTLRDGLARAGLAV